jgi:iron complex outermembrane receptor protein
MSLSGAVLENNLFLGLSGRFYEKDGFIKHADTGDATDDKQRWSGRAHLRWTPTDDLDISLIASHFQYNDEAINFNLTEMGAAMFGLPAPGYREVSSNMEGENDTRDDSQALKIKYNINNSLSLTSVTTNSVYSDKLEMDYDFSSYTLSHGDKDNYYSLFSQELRLDSSTERFNWLLGLYYDKSHIDFYIIGISDYPSMAEISDRDIYSDSYAAFAHFSWPITGKLSLVGGLRYEKEDYEYEDHVYANKVDESWDAITPKIALEYRFTPYIMVYVNVSEGYRSGGFNPYANDPQYYSFDPETLWSYEIGFKSAFLNNRVIFNGTGYYMDITDMQVTQAVSPAESYTTNAAEASVTGGELEVTARVLEGLTLMAGLGYSKAEFDAFKDALGNYKGNTVPFAPDYTYNVGAQYRHGSGFFVRGDWIGYGKTYFDKANEYSRDAYQIVNAKIGYETENFDIYLYAKNLFDEEYDSVGYYSGYYTIYSEPRETGLQLVYRF